MAYTTVNKSTDHFNVKLYTGNGSSGHSITGVGFQPDLVWIKNRQQSYSHFLTDAVRGVTKEIYSNANGAEYTRSNGLTAFGADGFTVGDNNGHNQNGNNLVSWNWKAGTGQGSSNTDGSINTTYTSVNTTAGFSISKYTGTGANATVGHGLGVAPSMIIVKNISSNSDNWAVYHEKLGANNWLKLNTTDASATDTTIWNNTAPTSNVFSVGTYTNNNGNGNDMIAYCFAEKTGYSKFGSYKGNGNSDGVFVYTGFKPSWVMLKQSSGSADDWGIYDTTIQPNNEMDTLIRPDTNAAEYDGGSGRALDILSNGFKLRTNNATFNEVETYIYMAFAEEPVVASNNTAATAR